MTGVVRISRKVLGFYKKSDRKLSDKYTGDAEEHVCVRGALTHEETDLVGGPGHCDDATPDDCVNNSEGSHENSCLLRFALLLVLDGLSVLRARHI